MCYISYINCSLFAQYLDVYDVCGVYTMVPVRRPYMSHDQLFFLCRAVLSNKAGCGFGRSFSNDVTYDNENYGRYQSLYILIHKPGSRQVAILAVYVGTTVA